MTQPHRRTAFGSPSGPAYQPTNAEIMEAIQAINRRLDAMEKGPQVREYLTVKEAAAEFKLSVASLYRMTHLHHRRGKTVRIRRADLVREMRPDPLAR